MHNTIEIEVNKKIRTQNRARPISVTKLVIIEYVGIEKLKF